MNILVFGQLIDVIGKEEISIDAENLSEVREKLIELYPDLDKYTYQISVNHEIEINDRMLRSSDELALLPPFAGG